MHLSFKTSETSEYKNVCSVLGCEKESFAKRTTLLFQSLLRPRCSIKTSLGSHLEKELRICQKDITNLEENKWVFDTK